MKIISIIILLLLPLLGFAQNETKNERLDSIPREEVYTIVEQMPEFTGGEQAMRDYIIKNIVYPKQEKKQGIQGTVYIQCVISQTGEVKDAKVVRGVPNGEALDKEALRVVSSMPDWKPGMQSGNPVSVSYFIPIKFYLGK
jgi:protein TonB